jgi:ornithine carbamoyltransferase
MSIRHFIDLQSIHASELRRILDLAKTLKDKRARGENYMPLAGKSLAMVFEKHSTRTRVSFEVGMRELGGHGVFLTNRDMQLGRGETVADTARVLSRYVHAIMLRCHAHEMLSELANHSQVPVINGLSNASHPCQIMADIMTYEEHRGSIAGKVVAYVGDGNNICNTFITAAQKFDFTLRIATPASLAPCEKHFGEATRSGAKIVKCETVQDAVAGSHLVVTDTWVSMGDTDTDARVRLLTPFQVNIEVMALADPAALFMHCLPAHREEEVTSEVIDGAQSVVWDEAENRLHAQKAILLWCMGVI